MAEQQPMIVERAALLAQLEKARERQSALGQQRRVMREEIFGVDDQLIARHVAELRADAGEGADLVEAEFRRDAAMLMTPQQLRALRERLSSKSLRHETLRLPLLLLACSKKTRNAASPYLTNLEGPAVRCATGLALWTDISDRRRARWTRTRASRATSR